MLRNIQQYLSYHLFNLLLCLLLAISFATAQRSYAAVPTVEMVEEQLALLNDSAGTNTVSIDRLQQIKQYLQEIADLQQKNAKLELLLQQAQQRKEALDQKLQQATAAQPEAIAESALASEIEQSLATEKARNKEWIEQLAQLNREQQRLLEAQETLPVDIAEQEQIIEQQIKVNKALPEGEANKVSKWLAEAEQAVQEEKLQWLTLQQETLLQRREEAKINAQILEHQLTLTSKRIGLLQARLLELSTRSSLKVIEQAKQLNRALSDAPVVIQQWNAKNETLALEFETLNRQLLLTQQAIQELADERLRVTQNLAQVKGNIKWLRNSPAFSDAIRAQLLLLPDLSDKSDLQKAITAAHLQHFQLSNELFKLKDIPALINEIAQDSALSELHKTVLNSILNFRYEVLNKTLEKTDQFIAEITRLDALQDQFSLEIQAERDFLKEKQLFIRDRLLFWDLSFLDLNRWFGTSSLPERLRALAHQITSHRGELVLLGLFLLLISALILQVKKVEKRYRLEYAKVVGKVRKDAFIHTLILLLLAICYGALLSFSVFVVDRWIELRLGAFYSYDLNNILISACAVILVWESLVRLAVADGVLELHFAFPREVLRWLKSTLSKQRWLLYSLLLSMLFSEMLADDTESPLLRILFIVFIFWLSAFINILLKHHRLPVLLPAFMQSSVALYLLKALLILPLIAIATLSVWGYFYASWVALFYYYAVLLSFYCAFLLQQLGIRWLKIKQRKISLQRALEKRDEQLQHDQSSHALSDEVDELTLSVEQISEQSQVLLNLAVLVFLFAMLSTLLSDSLLALQWTSEVIIWEVVTITDTGNIVEAISLKAALSALIILGVSVFFTKNLPGMLEVLLFHRLNISTGAAYATTTLLRYLLVLSGILIAVSTLGFNWSRLQWLIAALSVGLGFGLQEIFANLVSGIILLFERPVRVGDTITIQGLSGTVMRINTRATTILDWDNKEIVVPNKALITEQLVNWSLSNAVTRVIIPVGVAYGSDIQLVKKLLIQAAGEYPEISRDPAPQALLLLFGNSSLDFELRIFLAQVEGLVAIKDKVNTRIEQLFKEHGVEIPFPQMDLHVRELPGSE